VGAPLAVDALRAVANNTATPEQLDTLTQQGLARVVQGQPVITDAGLAMLPPEERPRLTEAERVAEIQQQTQNEQPTSRGSAMPAGGEAVLSITEADLRAVENRIRGTISGADDARGGSIRWPVSFRGGAAGRAEAPQFATVPFSSIRAMVESLGARFEESSDPNIAFSSRVEADGSQVILLNPRNVAAQILASGVPEADASEVFGTAFYEEIVHLADDANARADWAALPEATRGGFNAYLRNRDRQITEEIFSIVRQSKSPQQALGVLSDALSRSFNAYMAGQGATISPQNIFSLLAQNERLATSIQAEFIRQMVQQDLIGATTEVAMFRRFIDRVLAALDRLISYVSATEAGAFGDTMKARLQGTKAVLLSALDQFAPQTINTPSSEIQPSLRPLTGDAQRNETLARRRRGAPTVPTGLRTIDGAPLQNVSPTLSQATQARALEAAQTPGAQDTWIGTAEEYLAENPDAAFVADNPTLEAFYDPAVDRAVILTDRVQVREGDAVRAARNGTSAGLEAVRRLIRHESFVHRGWRALPKNLKDEFLSISENVVPADDLDQLAKIYKRFANWRNDSSLRALAVEEWLAQRLERIEKLPAGSDSVLNQLVDWAKRVWQWLAGDDSVEPTRAELVDLMRQMVRALETGEKEGVMAGAQIRPSYIGENAEMSQFMRDSLDAARTMAAEGKTSEEIRAVTGWFPGRYDGKMRWEIPDNEAAWVRGLDWKEAGKSSAKPSFYGAFSNLRGDDFSPGTLPLASLLNHPALYEVYPDLKNVAVRTINIKPAKAAWGPAGITIDYDASPAEAMTSLLHEIQHWIQNREGFASGANLKSSKVIDALIDEGYKKLPGNEQFLDAVDAYESADRKLQPSSEAVIASALAKRGEVSDRVRSELDSYHAAKKRLLQILDVNGIEAFSTYLRVAGEIESRDVQARQNFTPEQRKAIVPYSAENIAPEDAIVMFGTLGDIRFSLTGNEGEIERIIREDRDDAESGVVATRARPLAPGASPTSATEQINGQEIIERNQLQKTSLQKTRENAIKIVDALGPMDTWLSNLLNPAWQEQRGFNIRSPLGQYVIAEALNRVSNVSKKDRLRYGTLNDLLARQWQTGATESATALAARSGITSDPRYAALFAVQAMIDEQRKRQAGIIDPALGSTEATVAATLNADTEAQQQATEDVDSELRLKDMIYDMGLAAQDPEVIEDIKAINENVFRVGVLMRLRQKIANAAAPISPSMVEVSASAVEAEYAGLTVEQIDALINNLNEDTKTRTNRVIGKAEQAKATRPRSTPKTVVEQAKDLIEKLEAAPGVKKTPKPNPVRDLYKAHLKQPMAEGDFVRAMVGQGVPEADAQKLYELAAVKIAAAEVVAAQKEAERQAREADKPTPAEAFAARTINEVANRLADPASSPAEKEQKVLPIRELYKEHVRDGLPLDVFVQRAVTAGLDEQTAFILHGVGSMERDAAEIRRGYNEAGAAQRFAERVVDEAAARFADPALPQPVRNKRKNAIRELYAAHVKTPMGRDAFVEAARKLGVDERTAATMHGVGTMENEARAIQKDARNVAAEARRLNDRTARLLDTDKNSLENLINKLRPKITGGLNWREIFDRPLSNQREWRQQLFDTLRADPALANLSPAEVRDLAAEIDRIWNTKREAAFKALAKRMNLPGAREGVKEKIAESAPALIRYINSGAFNDVNFRNAIADKFGVPQLDEARVDEVIALVQKAQEAKTQVERNKYMNQAIRLMQEGMKAELGEVISNYWVTSVLSGFATLFDMALSVLNGARVMTQFSADAIIRQRDFKLAGRAAKNYFQTLGNAILESAYYVTSGDPSLLDNYQFTLDTYMREGSAAANPFDYFERLIRDPNKSSWAKIVPYYFAGLQRIMTAFDHINSTATTQGVLEHAMAYNRDKYIDARMPSKEDVAVARAKAVALVGGDKTWAQKRLVSSYTRQNLNELLGERYPGLLDEAKDIGRIASYQNDPTGIGGMVYHTLLGVTNKWVSAAATTRAEGRAQGDAQALTDKMMREVNFFLSVNSRNMTGTRFVRFVGNRVNELLSFMPGAGLVRLKEKGMTPTKRAMLIQNQVVGTMLSLWAAVTLLRMMEDEEDEEKRGLRVEGSWQRLTPDQKNQRRASGASPNSIGIWDGEKWVNFNYTPWPVASILATVGNISDIKRFHPDKWDAKDIVDKLATVVWSGAFSFKDLSALSGFMDLLGASAYSTDPVDSSIKWLGKFSANFAGGIVPRMLKDIDMIMDPEARRPGSPSEYFFKEVPFFRRLELGGEKMYNIFGDPVQINRLPWRRVVTASRPEREYQILAELNNRGLFLGVANPDNRTVGYGASRRELTDEEAERYAVETGKRYRQFILDQGERLLEMDEARAKELLSRRTEALRNAALRDAIRTQP
jgi:predicted transcriptional regulator